MPLKFKQNAMFHGFMR